MEMKILCSILKKISQADELGLEVGENLKNSQKVIIKSKMHILFTRSLEDSKDLILRFNELGHKVSYMPVIEIKKLIMM